jgi:hypothetical protein
MKPIKSIDASAQAAPIGKIADEVQYLRNVVADAAPMLRAADFPKTAYLLEGAVAAIAISAQTAPADVRYAARDVIDMSDAKLHRENLSDGTPHWQLRNKNGLVRWLTTCEAEFVDAALRCRTPADDSQKGGGDA